MCESWQSAAAANDAEYQAYQGDMSLLLNRLAPFMLYSLHFTGSLWILQQAVRTP
jgi:hypothetical protein